MEEDIKQLKKAKEAVAWLLANAEGLVDFHNLEYWAGVVVRLRQKIKENL